MRIAKIALKTLLRILFMCFAYFAIGPTFSYIVLGYIAVCWMFVFAYKLCFADLVKQIVPKFGNVITASFRALLYNFLFNFSAYAVTLVVCILVRRYFNV